MITDLLRGARAQRTHRVPLPVVPFLQLKNGNTLYLTVANSFAKRVEDTTFFKYIFNVSKLFILVLRVFIASEPEMASLQNSKELEVNAVKPQLKYSVQFSYNQMST